MCSRFELITTPKAIKLRFGFSVNKTAFKKTELRPSDQVLLITSQGPQIMRWGLMINWSAKLLINARSETLGQKKTFRSLLKNRCLIPASAYFEWQKNGKVKIKNRIAHSDKNTHDHLFAFAGLYDEKRFAIITCQPSQSISHIHDRMPVVVDKDSESLWINPRNSFDTASKILIPFQAGKLKAEESVSEANPEKDLFSLR